MEGEWHWGFINGRPELTEVSSAVTQLRDNLGALNRLALCTKEKKKKTIQYIQSHSSDSAPNFLFNNRPNGKKGHSEPTCNISYPKTSVLNSLAL